MPSQPSAQPVPHLQEFTAHLEFVRCNLCGADDAETVYDRLTADGARDMVRVFRASGDDLLKEPLVRCRRCGLQYVNPRPRAIDIVHAYSAGDDPAYVSQVAARERTFAGAVARIERLLPGRGRLLDVGTAAGAFLAAARRRGWEVDGCEPNRWTAAWGSNHYGLRIRPGELFDHDFPAGVFEVVTLWDVIEHTADPSRVIRRIAELVKPGGLVIVNYPDIGSSIAQMLGRRWPFLSAVHLYDLTRPTMRALLEGNGFEIVDMRPHVQRLEMDYLLARGAAVSDRASRWARRVVRLLGLADRQTPYWMGQTFVAARRLPLQP